MVLEMGQLTNIDPEFNLSDYPELISFDGYASKGLYKVDPTKCTKLQRLSIDGTNVSSLNLSNNPNITILNISDTGIKEIDLSNLTYLQQFYADHQSSTMNTDCKLTSLDVSKNKKLVYLFASGNLLKEIDAEEFIAVKGFKAKGKRVTTFDVLDVKELEPTRFPEPEKEEGEDGEGDDAEDTNLDPDAGKSQQQVIDEMTGQLNLFTENEDL